RHLDLTDRAAHRQRSCEDRLAQLRDDEVDSGWSCDTHHRHRRVHAGGVCGHEHPFRASRETRTSHSRSSAAIREFEEPDQVCPMITILYTCRQSARLTVHRSAESLMCCTVHNRSTTPARERRTTRIHTEREDIMTKRTTRIGIATAAIGTLTLGLLAGCASGGDAGGDGGDENMTTLEKAQESGTIT